MTDVQTSAATKINPLRARLVTLASDPRVRLVPAGGEIVRECVGLLDLVGDLEKRVAQLERALAAVTPRELCDES